MNEFRDRMYKLKERIGKMEYDPVTYYLYGHLIENLERLDATASELMRIEEAAEEMLKCATTDTV